MARDIVNLMVGLFMATMLGLTGCGGGGGSNTDNTMATTNKVVSSVTVIDGNNQTASVGTEISYPLVALIKNSEGQPIASQTVNFKVTSGGGTVFAGAATSDAIGVVRERWTLGTVAGTQKVEVRAVDSSGTAVVYATFEAIAVAGAPQTIGIATGDGQSAQQLQALQLPLKVIVKDTYGNPKSGVSVEFTANNGGTASPGSASTDVAGEASAIWTLGLAIGTQTLSAAVTGMPPLSFGATATQAPPSAPTSLTKASGESQTIVQYSLSAQPLSVLITDKFGNPIPNIPVTFTSSIGSSYIESATVNTNDGIASWDGYRHTAGEQTIVASALGLAPVTFNVSVTASTHKYDGSYNCSYSSNTSYNLSIVEGVVSLTNGFSYGNTTPLPGARLDETTGIFVTNSFYAGWPSATINLQLQVDSRHQATGTGTVSINMPSTHGPNITNYASTCSRN